MVKASHIRSVKIKTVKICSEESGHISAKFCTSKNFPVYGKLVKLAGRELFKCLTVDLVLS